MKRVLLVILVVLGVTGCDRLSVVAGDSVPIVTALPVEDDGLVGCYTIPSPGRLFADPVFGTRLEMEPAQVPTVASGPVAWPAGFTARRAGSEIEVHGPSGELVAVTGRRYAISPPVNRRVPPVGFEGEVMEPGCMDELQE